jgi:hypothetical protein
MSGGPIVAYLVTLTLDEQETLDPEFEGGNQNLRCDIVDVGGSLLRGIDLQFCFTSHIRIPSKLLGSVPTRVIVKPTEGDYLPDFGFAPWGGWKLVSQAFVNIVERLEPGVHEFLPIAKTFDQKGRLIDKRFFLMNILQQFNAVDVERSSVKFNEHHHSSATDGKKLEFSYKTMQLIEPRRLVLKRALVVGHHLWHGTTQDIYHVFFSNALHDAVRAVGLSSLRYNRAEEV